MTSDQGWRVRVRSPQGRVVGAGFLVDRRRVVTCAHVVADALGVSADGPRPAEAVLVDFHLVWPAALFSARVATDGWMPIGRDDRGDVAVLELHDPPPPTVTPAPLRQAPDSNARGISTFGFPTGIDHGEWAHGVIVGIGGPAGEWVQLDAATVTGRRIGRGFSGAAVHDSQAGGVVGMIVANDASTEARIGWMLPVRGLIRSLPSLADLLPSRLRLDSEFRHHWEPRGRGVDRHVRPGWYFTGRTAALRELVTWLTSPAGADRHARVVTGRPGSGKSAVLARLVTLTDPGYRAQLPPEVLASVPAGTVPPLGGVDIAIHAKGRTVEQITGVLAQAIGLPEGLSVDNLVDEILERGPLTIVVDALDEAHEGRRLARALLRPLATDGGRVGVRLLVGTRRELVDMLGGKINVLDLDDPAYLDPDDLADYVSRLLSADDDPAIRSPYRTGDLKRVGLVARAVAARAYPSFLVAQLTAWSLAEDDHVVDVGEVGWEERFPSSVADAMDAYLARFGEHEQRVTDLLLPLAFAEEPGLLADRLWARLAGALSGRTYVGADVGWLLDTAAAYLIAHGEQDDQPVWRLFHQALVDYLRGRYDLRDAQQQFTSELLASVPDRGDRPGKDWLGTPPHPYVQRSLATHAAAAGQLDGLVEDPGFLLTADPPRLLMALARVRTPPALRAGGVYRQTLPYLLTYPVDYAAAYLRLHARQLAADELAERIVETGVHLPWSVTWAYWQTIPHHALGRHAGGVNTVEVAEIRGRKVAVTGGSDHTLRLWDLREQRELAELAGHNDAITALAVGKVDGSPVAVTTSKDATARVWDLNNKRDLGQLAGHTGCIWHVAIGEVDGKPVAVTVGNDATARLWDLRDHRQLARLTTQRRPIYGVAVGQVDGRPVAVTAGDDGTVRVWDLQEPKELAQLRGHTSAVYAVAIGEVDGRSVAVTAGADATARVWDLRRHDLLAPLSGHEAGIEAVTVGTVDGHPVAITGSNDRTARIWDLREYQPWQQLAGHNHAVQGVAIGEVDDRPVAVTASGDGTARVWDLRQDGRIARNAGWPWTVTTGLVDGRPMAVTAGRDAVVRVWGLREHRILDELSTDELSTDDGLVYGVGLGRLDGRPIIVTGSHKGPVGIWDLRDRRRLGQLLGHTDRVCGVAVGQVDDRPIAVTGSHDGSIRVWDLRGRWQLGELLGHTARVWSVAVCEIDGHPVAVSGSDDATVRMWDLREYCQLAEFSGHYRGVGAVAVSVLDGRPVAASAGGDRTVRVWDLLERSLCATLRGHTDTVYAVTAGTMGGREVLVSGGKDQTVRIWDLRDETQLVIRTETPVLALAPTSTSGIILTSELGLLVVDLG